MSAIDNKQLKAAQAEAATATDTYTHVFKKPFTYEDKTYEQLTLDFGSLTGRDFMAIDREVREREGRVPIVPVYDTSFLMRMVCRASKEKIDYDTFVSGLSMLSHLLSTSLLYRISFILSRVFFKIFLYF